MMIRLLAKTKTGQALDYDLIDVLRAISAWSWDAVIGHYWQVSDLSLHSYSHLGGGADVGALELLFPEKEFPTGDVAWGKTVAVADGERLMERCAIIHQFEEGLFLRLIDPAIEAVCFPDMRFYNGPDTFQATNTDLEIRCDEGPYEIVSDDARLIAYLQGVFAETEVR